MLSFLLTVWTANCQKDSGEDKTILSGFIQLTASKAAKGENDGGNLVFKLYSTGSGLVCLELTMKKADSAYKPPLELMNKLLKSLQATSVKAFITSNEKSAIISPLKIKKGANMISEGQKILDQVAKSLPTGAKVRVENY